MADLNNIQDEIMAEMAGDLIDVSFPFTATRTINGTYDPDAPQSNTALSYSGTGIFGLSFTQRDLEIFQVESNDMKAIIFQRSATNTPQIDDTITWRGTPYKVVNISVIPADNGVVCQLRAYQ